MQERMEYAEKVLANMTDKHVSHAHMHAQGERIEVLHAVKHAALQEQIDLVEEVVSGVSDNHVPSEHMHASFERTEMLQSEIMQCCSSEQNKLRCFFRL